MKTINFLSLETTENWSVDDDIYIKRMGWFPFQQVYRAPDLACITNDYLKENYQTEYKIKKFDEIDKSKPWFVFLYTNFQYRINFNIPESYSSKQLFAGIPEDVLHELKYGQAYLMLSCENEAYTKNFFNLFYSLYYNNPSIPCSKIIYLTAASNVHELYGRFCETNCIPEENKIQVWYSHHGWLDQIRWSVNNFQKKDLPKERKFLNLNRVARSHRVAFSCLLAEYDLLDQGYVSLGIRNNTWPGIDGLWDYINTHFFVYFQWKKNEEPFQKTLAGVNKLKDKLPLYVDNPDLEFNHVGYDAAPYDYYNRTYFSIVASTWCFKRDEEGLTVNEKEFKTILGRHPFLLVSRPGALALLKKIGFKTFDQWFDESYDQEEDDGRRLIKLVKETERLCKLTNEQWDVMIKEMEPTLEHNFDLLVNHTQEISFNLTDLRQLLKYAV